MQWQWHWHRYTVQFILDGHMQSNSNYFMEQPKVRIQKQHDVCADRPKLSIEENDINNYLAI